ncbi:MAG TPA: sialate O-acetylesterase [Chitinophagaceae bacterium]|nr:sialate O-acetylesterase [Chitinophagaceae bacterium]
MAGAIWYQGESNTLTAASYRQLFTTMITSWRSLWGKNFPFYYVQIAPFKYGNKNIAALLREAQTQSMQLDNTGMVVITDITGDTMDIHPKDKPAVGMRLANWALAETYHKAGLVYKNALYRAIEVSGNKAIVSFDNAGGKLTCPDKAITQVYVAGSDKVFYPAQATIDNDKLVVWSPQVSQPVAVRYAFSNTAIGNLFGPGGLPVNPFRTDDWIVDTSDNK